MKAGTGVQSFPMEVDSWMSEYIEVLHLKEDVEKKMKKYKKMIKNVNSNYIEQSEMYGLVCKKITKMWQILDRLDALQNNPCRTSITEQEHGRRGKLLEEERSKVMQLGTAFQDYCSSCCSCSSRFCSICRLHNRRCAAD